MTVRDIAMKADDRLDSWPAEMPVEDRFRRLQAHSLVITVEQLGSRSTARGDNVVNRVRNPSGGFGLARLPMVPGTQ